MLKFGQYFAADGYEVMKLNLGRGSEARFVKILKLKISRDADVWLIF